MLTIVAVVLALTVLPSPWGWIAVLGAFAIDATEAAFFVRWSKRRRAVVGAATLVGRSAVVVRTLSPRGQVKLDGEVWEAFSATEVERGQEFRKCIECFLCQNTCHVIRDHEENKPAFAGPRFFLRYAELDMHPLDTNDRRKLAQDAAGLGMCNITKC